MAAEHRRATSRTLTSSAENVGRIEEIQGVVIEAVFPDELPQINNAITRRAARTSEGND